MIRKVLAGALCAALVAIVGLGLLLRQEMAAGALLIQEKALSDFALAGCTARAATLQRDKESDDAIDRIPDADLRNVPDRWLRQETAH